MTKLLEKAFEEARKLPAKEQDAIGARLLEEIADEAKWEKSFVERPDVLESWPRKHAASTKPG